MSGRGGLEDGGQQARARGEIVHCRIVQIKHEDEDNVYEIHRKEDAKEHPGWFAREEERVAAAGMLQEEAERFLRGGVVRAEFEHGPDYEP